MKNKLVKCKACGADIAKTAKRCPNCGAQQHVVALTFVWLIVVAMFLMIFFVLTDAFSGSDKQVSAQSAAPIEISAPDLWNVYSDNEVNADNIYKDKLLAVTGTIIDIGKDIVTGNPCVSLNSGSEYNLYPVQCFFASSDKDSEELAALKNGQEITIYGTCTGAQVINVQLSDCYLSN